MLEGVSKYCIGYQSLAFDTLSSYKVYATGCEKIDVVSLKICIVNPLLVQKQCWVTKIKLLFYVDAGVIEADNPVSA